MEKEDIVNWLNRNKKFLSIYAIEKEIGVPPTYISWYVLGDKKYPKYAAPGREYIPYSELLDRIAKVIKSIRAF